MSNWLSRAGLLLQFAAIFLLTPQLLGSEERVARATNRTIKWMSSMALFYVVWVLIGVATCIGWVLVFTDSHGARASITAAALAMGPFWFGLLFSKVTYRAMEPPARAYLGVGLTIFTVGFACLMAATFVN